MEYQQQISKIKYELEKKVLSYEKGCVGHETSHVLEATKTKCKKQGVWFRELSAYPIERNKQTTVKREIMKVRTRIYFLLQWNGGGRRHSKRCIFEKESVMRCKENNKLTSET